MRYFPSVLTSIFSLFSSYATTTNALQQQEGNWPYNLPPHLKYWPEDEGRWKRSVEAPKVGKSRDIRPIGVVKMGLDEGQKFLMDYWQLPELGEQEASMPSPEAAQALTTPRLRPRSIEPDTTNSSAQMQFRPPFLLHTDDQVSLNPHFKRDIARYSSRLFGALAGGPAALQKRGFQCPTGTSNCANVGRPNSCCAQGESCQIIEDVGLGDVGCCPAGVGCTGAVRSCDAGFTGCSDSIGGCCIPMYVCVASGCK